MKPIRPTGVSRNSDRIPSPTWNPAAGETPGVAPGRIARKHTIALLLLDALRGAKTYVRNYTVGRGAE